MKNLPLTLPALSLWGSLLCAPFAHASEAPQALPPFARQAKAVEIATALTPAQLRPFFLASTPNHPPQPYLDELRAAIVRAHAAADPSAVFALCNAVENQDERCALLEILGRVWADHAPDAAISAALTLGSGPYVDAMMAGIFERLAEKNPAQAYDLLQKTVAANPRAFHLSIKALGRVVRLWCMQDPAAALAAAQAFDANMRAASGLDLIIRQWMKADREVLIASMKNATPEMRAHWIEVATYGQRLSADQSAFLIQLMRAAPPANPSGSDYRTATLLRNMPDATPAEKWKILVGFGDAQTQRENAAEIFSQWLQTDTPTATQALFSISDATLRGEILRKLAQTQLRLVPADELLRQATLLDNQSDIQSTAIAYLSNGGDFDRLMNATQDPWRRTVFLYAALLLPNAQKPTARRAWVLTSTGDNRVRYLIRMLEDEDLAEALTWAQANLSGTERYDVVRTLTRAGFPEFPELTLAAFNAVPEGRTRQDLIASMARNIARKDPVAAIQWLNTLPPSFHRTKAYLSALEKIAEQSPKTAAALATHVPLTVWQIDGAQKTITDWAWQTAQGNPEKTLEWAQSIPDDAMRQLAVRQVIERWIVEDRAGLVARMETVENDPQRRIPEDAVKTLGRYWAKMNPPSLARWIALRPDSRLSAIMMGPLMASWPMRDLPAVLQWLDSLPPGDLRTRAVLAWAHGSAAEIDPEALFEQIVLLPANATTSIDGQSFTRADALLRIFTIFKNWPYFRPPADTAPSAQSLSKMQRAFEDYLARPEITDAERQKIRAQFPTKQPR